MTRTHSNNSTSRKVTRVMMVSASLSFAASRSDLSVRGGVPALIPWASPRQPLKKGKRHEQGTRTGSWRARGRNAGAGGWPRYYAQNRPMKRPQETRAAVRAMEGQDG